MSSPSENPSTTASRPAAKSFFTPEERIRVYNAFNHIQEALSDLKTSLADVKTAVYKSDQSSVSRELAKVRASCSAVDSKLAALLDLKDTETEYKSVARMVQPMADSTPTDGAREDSIDSLVLNSPDLSDDDKKRFLPLINQALRSGCYPECEWEIHLMEMRTSIGCEGHSDKMTPTERQAEVLSLWNSVTEALADIVSHHGKSFSRDRRFQGSDGKANRTAALAELDGLGILFSMFGAAAAPRIEAISFASANTEPSSEERRTSVSRSTNS